MSFWWWFCLACSSTGFSGFLPGKLMGKQGAGGGTAGTVVALIPLLMTNQLSPGIMLAGIVVSFAAGLVVIEPAEMLMVELWGERVRHTGVRVSCDFNETNIDELHGMWIAVFPLSLVTLSWFWYLTILLLAFGIFRYFDAKKTGPVRFFEDKVGEKGSGFNIMIDDTVAGAMTALAILPLCLLAA